MANRPMIDAGGMGAREGGSYGLGGGSQLHTKELSAERSIEV